MSTTLGNGNITFGDGTNQSTAQLNNYNWINQQWAMSRNGSQTYTMSAVAGPQGKIFLNIDSPWTCTEDVGLIEHFFYFNTSSDGSTYTNQWTGYQYSNGYSGRYTAGNFSLSWPITGLSNGQTYYFQFVRSSGNSATENWLTVTSWGV